MRYLTIEEYQLASRFLFLSMAITVIQRDLAIIERGAGLKIKEPYLVLLKKMENEAMLERQQLRKYMYDQKLKVIPLERNDTFTAYLFICRNREEQRNYFNPAIRKKVEHILEELMLKSYLSEGSTVSS
ncbi:hypothetical protein [Amphibacillus indicireducens]|uniref:Uncharacterized protein n=1 Tax=Amphibacillus indicireducens TaxID=1076330 RepID=A0ABP7VHW4_9BACI